MGDFAAITGTSASNVPYLKRVPKGYQIVVHGKPFLMLPAELHNSSFSSPEFMHSIWPKLKSCNVNTVLANVTWEAIEPEEGHFDFARLDQCILDARKHGMQLVLLWFGSFKNGKSNYAPRWVKTNPALFPRMMIRANAEELITTDVLSILDTPTVEADAKAFGMLMKHLKEIDADHSTVLMVQVENEVGLLGGARDASPTADARFNGPVPSELVEMLTDRWHNLHTSLQENLQKFKLGRSVLKTGVASWPQTFGSSLATDELFMAYHYALFVEQVACAGRKEYALPLYTNVWQNYADEDADKSQPVVVGGGGCPGDYPSGGGVINVLDIWQSFAPTLDFISPDVYLNDYDAVCKKYRHNNQPLFIPEQRRDEYGARRIWCAYGAHNALGASPFAIDSQDDAQSVWGTHFGLLAQVSPWLLDAQGAGRDVFGFFFDELFENQQSPESYKVRMAGWSLTIERSFVFGRPGPGFGMIIHVADSRFLLVGEGFQVRFASTKAHHSFTGILAYLEKLPDASSGTLVTGRVLNGDETRSGELAIMPNKQPDLGSFPICITIPARSSIAEVEVYSF